MKLDHASFAVLHNTALHSSWDHHAIKTHEPRVLHALGEVCRTRCCVLIHAFGVLLVHHLHACGNALPPKRCKACHTTLLAQSLVLAPKSAVARDRPRSIQSKPSRRWQRRLQAQQIEHGRNNCRRQRRFSLVCSIFSATIVVVPVTCRTRHAKAMQSTRNRWYRGKHRLATTLCLSIMQACLPA